MLLSVRMANIGCNYDIALATICREMRHITQLCIIGNFRQRNINIRHTRKRRMISTGFCQKKRKTISENIRFPRGITKDHFLLVIWLDNGQETKSRSYTPLKVLKKFLKFSWKYRHSRNNSAGLSQYFLKLKIGNVVMLFETSASKRASRTGHNSLLRDSRTFPTGL